MNNVLKFPAITRHDISTKEMLVNIAESNPSNAFVIVWHSDESMPTYHSNTSYMPVVLMRVQEFIHKYYNGDFE